MVTLAGGSTTCCLGASPQAATRRTTRAAASGRGRTTAGRCPKDALLNDCKLTGACSWHGSSNSSIEQDGFVFECHPAPFLFELALFKRRVPDFAQPFGSVAVIMSPKWAINWPAARRDKPPEGT